jgi:hypothetical protein
MRWRRLKRLCAISAAAAVLCACGGGDGNGGIGDIDFSPVMGRWQLAITELNLCGPPSMEITKTNVIFSGPAAHYPLLGCFSIRRAELIADSFELTIAPLVRAGVPDCSGEPPTNETDLLVVRPEAAPSLLNTRSLRVVRYPSSQSTWRLSVLAEEPPQWCPHP